MFRKRTYCCHVWGCVAWPREQSASRVVCLYSYRGRELPSDKSDWAAGDCGHSLPVRLLHQLAEYLRLRGQFTDARITADRALADELLDAAAGKTREEIADLLAARFPRPDRPTVVQTIPEPSSDLLAASDDSASSCQLAPGRVGTTEAQQPNARRPRIEPLSAESVSWQFTSSREFASRFQYVRSLLGNAVPDGDVVKVLARCMDEAIANLGRLLVILDLNGFVEGALQRCHCHELRHKWHSTYQPGRQEPLDTAPIGTFERT